MSLGINLISKQLIIGEEMDLEVNNELKESSVVFTEPDAEDVLEHFVEKGFSDGLPVIPPTKERVERMLSYSYYDPGKTLIHVENPRGAPVTVEKLAISAVMAGCRPEYFPLLTCIFEAMGDKNFHLGELHAATYPSSIATIFSGPVADEVGICSGSGCLGPGFRANATIGRAIRLALIYILGIVPGSTDGATLGTPAKYSFCFAENIKKSPWEPLHVDLYDHETTSVTVFCTEGPHNIVDHTHGKGEDILATIAMASTSLAANNAYWPCSLLIVLSPDHARIISASGFSKRDVKLFIYENARNSLDQIKKGGIAEIELNRPKSHFFTQSYMVPCVRDPEDVIVVVAGGGGPMSVIARPWGLSFAVNRAIRLKSGVPALSVRDFLGT